MDIALIAGFGDSIVSFRGPLLEAMRARGLRVLVLSPGLSPTTRKWLDARRIHWEELPLARTGMNPFTDLLYCARLAESLRKYRPRAVLAYTVKPVVYGLPVARLSGVERRYALITGLGYAFTAGKNRWIGRLTRALYKAALRFADGATFQNPDDLACFRDEGLIDAGVPVQVVNGSGIDLQYFRQAPTQKQSIRFLMIARLLGDKGVREYAGAARLLKAKYPEVTWSLAGWIDENPDAICQSELDAWIQDGSLKFLGRLDDVRPALAEASVYVLPSYREGTPRTVLEAMAVGRAIITTDAPGCRETVRAGRNGFLVPVGARDALVDAMERFICDPSLVETMGAASRELAESKYDVHSVNRSMLLHMRLLS